jgi:hypothetical protein
MQLLTAAYWLLATLACLSICRMIMQRNCESGMDLFVEAIVIADVRNNNDKQAIASSYYYLARSSHSGSLRTI